MKQATTFPSATGNQRPTKIEKLYNVLKDGNWHSTKELARKVGHTFGVAKFKLQSFGYRVQVDPHPSKRWQFRYRLVDEA